MKVRRCKKCGLSQFYPGISFNKQGICNYCIYYLLNKPRENIIKDYLKKEFLNTIFSIKKESHKYDCIMGLSGGKDSTFLLYYLVKVLNLKVLVCTADNGFLSDTAKKNIENITKKLNIKPITLKPDLKIVWEIYRYALTHYISYPKEILALLSPLCTVCHGIVFGTTLKLAIKLKIPIMFVGYTPGQYPTISLENFLKLKSCVFLSYSVYRDDPLNILKIIADPIREIFGEKINKYYFTSQYINSKMKPPKILFPYHALIDYDEKIILDTITNLGWEKPNDTDPSSTNCLLNGLGNYACMIQRGYNPYAGEYSYLVREGKMEMNQVIELEKIDDKSYPVSFSLNKLGLTKDDIYNLKYSKL